MADLARVLALAQLTLWPLAPVVHLLLPGFLQQLRIQHVPALHAMPCNIQQGAKYTTSIFRFRLIIGPTTRWVVHTYSYSKTIIMINHDNHC